MLRSGRPSSRHWGSRLTERIFHNGRCANRADELGGTGNVVESQMIPPRMEPSKQPTEAAIKFSKKRLAMAFAIAGISDAIGAFATPLPPVVWVVDLVTALLLFLVLGRQWLLLPGLALEAIPGFGVLPFWLLVVGAIAVLGTPRPTFQQR
jgi:hypothetical protein